MAFYKTVVRKWEESPREVSYVSYDSLPNFLKDCYARHEDEDPMVLGYKRAYEALEDPSIVQSL